MSKHCKKIIFKKMCQVPSCGIVLFVFRVVFFVFLVFVVCCVLPCFVLPCLVLYGTEPALAGGAGRESGVLATPQLPPQGTLEGDKARGGEMYSRIIEERNSVSYLTQS